jgi:hypothetical protein
MARKRLNQHERPSNKQKRRHKIVAKLELLHNDDSLPVATFASDAVKILTQIVALHRLPGNGQPMHRP